MFPAVARLTGIETKALARQRSDRSKSCARAGFRLPLSLQMMETDGSSQRAQVCHMKHPRRVILTMMGTAAVGAV
jgi:hypothetical protein